MSWSFETDSEFQAQLDWIETFSREEIEPLDLVFRGPGDPWDPDSPAALAMAIQWMLWLVEPPVASRPTIPLTKARSSRICATGVYSRYCRSPLRTSS